MEWKELSENKEERRGGTWLKGVWPVLGRLKPPHNIMSVKKQSLWHLSEQKARQSGWRGNFSSSRTTEIERELGRWRVAKHEKNWTAAVNGFIFTVSTWNDKEWGSRNSNVRCFSFSPALPHTQTHTNVLTRQDPRPNAAATPDRTTLLFSLLSKW